MRIAVWTLTACLLAAAAPAQAQDRPVHINFGGGPTFLFGDLGDGFSTGWGPAVGVTFDTSEFVSLQFEYAYRYHQLKDDLDILIGRFSANHTTHQLDFNMVANLTPRDSAVRVYVTGGPGMYYRSVEITEYEGTGIICDPWWWICGTYPIESVVGSRGGWDFGINVGAGVGFGLGESAEFYIESRYHHVYGSDVEISGAVPATTNRPKTTGQYLPLTFGFRF